MIVILFLKRLLLKVGHGWPVLLCADGFAPQSKPWMTGSALHEWIRAKKHPRKTTEARFVAGLGRVSFVETCSYARARQRLALWFARLFSTAAMKPGTFNVRA